MYAQNVAKNGEYTDQKTIITGYGWTSAMCVPIPEPYATRQNMDI
jgi:hypothetical protein